MFVLCPKWQKLNGERHSEEPPTIAAAGGGEQSERLCFPAVTGPETPAMDATVNCRR